MSPASGGRPLLLDPEGEKPGGGRTGEQAAMGRYDRSSKWLIQHHGDAILRLAGVSEIVSCVPCTLNRYRRAAPRRSGGGRCGGAGVLALFILEIASYPEARLLEQLVRDLALVFLNRRVLPEVLTLVLHPRRRRGVPSAVHLESPLGWTHLDAAWRTVELWKVPAEDLFATEDPGVVPWIPLSRFTGPPDPVLRRCRTLIEQRAQPDERANLLAVTQVLAKLRYNDPRLLSLLGGRDTMIESPLIREAVAETRQSDIRRVLEVRFGPLPQDITTALQAIQDEKRLDRLVDAAASSRDLEAFRARLES